MEERKNILDNYYNSYDEERRLVKDKSHNIEYLVTKEYIGKYLKPNDKILEIGAGTGRYSLHYAKEGYDVTAIEYVNHNLDILKSKITPDMKIRAEQGDAVDLSRFADNTFDITLVLGPLYHLFDKKDIDSAIKEAIRVTKKDGIIMMAYITSDGVFAEWGLDHLIDGYPECYDDNFKMTNYPENIFATYYIKEFKDMMNNYDVILLNNIASDGIANIVAEKINNLSEEKYKEWVKYQLSICEREDLQGFSCHMLYICKKK